MLFQSVRFSRVRAPLLALLAMGAAGCGDSASSNSVDAVDSNSLVTSDSEVSSNGHRRNPSTAAFIEFGLFRTNGVPNFFTYARFQLLKDLGRKGVDYQFFRGNPGVDWGGCKFFQPEPNEGPFFEVGDSLTVAGPAGSFTTARNEDAGEVQFYDESGSPSLYVPGGRYTLSAPGGRDVPAFSRSFVAPPDITVTLPSPSATPVPVSVQHDFRVRWTQTGTREPVWVALHKNDPIDPGHEFLICKFRDDGTASVDEKLLRKLGRGSASVEIVKYHWSRENLPGLPAPAGVAFVSDWYQDLELQ